MLNFQHIVLVDEKNNVLGIEDKIKGHNKYTKLHRGFSTYLFNSKRQIILQQRSVKKKTWPLFWSNSFCGHPQLNETTEQAILRHAAFELSVTNLQQLQHASDYKYKFEMHGNGICENEICPIYLALSDDQIVINPSEVAAVKYLEWEQLIQYIAEDHTQFTPWSKEQVSILNTNIIFKKFMQQFCI